MVGEKGELSRDFETGLGADRQANMVAFAVAALKLVKEFITAGEGQGAGTGDGEGDQGTDSSKI